MTDSLDGGKSLRGPSGHVRFPQEHRRASLHLHAIGFTPSGIADELNAQFGTSYSRRAGLLELGLPEGARGRAAAAQVPSGQQRTVRDDSLLAGKSLRGPAAHVRFPADAPPLDDGVPMSAIGSVEAERRALRRVDRLPLAVPPVRAGKRMEFRGSNVAAQTLVAIVNRGQLPHASKAARRSMGVLANSPAFSGGRGVPLSECRECRWPVAGEGAQTLFCDAPRAVGSSYCPAHKARAGGGFSFKG